MSHRGHSDEHNTVRRYRADRKNRQPVKSFDGPPEIGEVSREGVRCVWWMS